jgi:pimeloyl-ACP methyl ester carboxylesterase
VNVSRPDSTKTARPTATDGGSARRNFLRSVGALSIAVIAGCSSDGESGSTPTSATGDRPDSTGSPESAATATPTPDSGATPAETDSDPATLERRAKEFLTAQAEGSFDAAHERLIDATAANFSVADMEGSWQQIVRASGEFESIATSEYQQSTDGAAVVTVETAFARVKNTFRVVLTEEGVRGYQVTAQEEYSWEPPSYVDTSAFAETTVTLDATDTCELGGTLSLPAGEGQVPGVVIVHGSGPVDRDGTFGPNKPYKELAWGLASRGIAVLRYDKRTEACDVALSDVTIDDVATDDALSAVERLRAHGRVAEDTVFVAGHSIGGLLAPRIAERDGRLAGAVMLAPGPARPVAEAILDQQRHLLEQQDLSEAERENALADVRTVAEKIRSLDIGDEEVLLGLGGREYFRSLAEYDGPETAADLDVPLFVGQGGRDYQVTPDDDFPVWQSALSDRSAVRFERYSSLNHVFQDGTGPSTGAEYFDADAVFDQRVVEDVAAFVERHT